MKTLSIVFSLLLVNIFTQAQVLPEDSQQGVMQVLVSIDELDDYEADSLINIFITQCNTQERYWLKNQVVLRLYDASFPKYPTGELRKEMQNIGALIGDRAPDFKIQDISLSDIKGERLLFFYESTCSVCQEELENLKKDYQQLEMTLISIDCNVEYSHTRSWQYNIADSTGNVYIPYGIVRTPTFILVNSEGFIIGRYKQLSNLIK